MTSDDYINTKTDNSRNTLYQQRFKPDAYLDQFYTDPYSTDPVKCQFLFRGQLQLLHQAFKSGNIKGKTLLDVGCGPSVVFSIIPSLYYDEVYLCDLLTENRQALKLWLQNSPQAHDFQPYFDIAAKLRNISTPWNDGPLMLRSKICAVWACDLHTAHVIPEGTNPRRFDCVTASLILGPACTNNNDLDIVVHRLGNLLNPGGHLIIYNDIGSPEYGVGEDRYPSLVITRSNLGDALSKAGLKVLNWIYEENDDDGDSNIDQKHGHALIISFKI